MLSLAVSVAQRSIDDQKQVHGLWMLVVLVGTVGILGIFTLLLLFWTWRRYNRRYRSQRGGHEGPPAEDVDPWAASASRLRPSETDTDDNDPDSRDLRGGDDDAPPSPELPPPQRPSR